MEEKLQSVEYASRDTTPLSAEEKRAFWLVVPLGIVIVIVGVMLVVFCLMSVWR